MLLPAQMREQTFRSNAYTDSKIKQKAVIRTPLKILFWLILLACGAVLCATRWKVWFVNPEEPVWTGDTLDYHFVTYAVDSLPRPDSVRILVLGDIHSTMNRADYDTLTAREPNLTAYAQLGDWMDRGYFYYAQALLHELDSTALYALPVINCPGNHEYQKGIIRHLPELWTEMFPQPKNGPLDFVGTTYYVDYPNLRFITIDTNGLQHLRDYTRMVTWVKDAIHRADGRWTVVMMHHPVIASAKGRFNVGIFTFFYRTLCEADLVLAGHDHNYMRHMPFVNLSSVTTRSRKVQSVVTPEVEATEGAFYGVIEAWGDSLTMRVNRLNGEPIDVIRLGK